MNRAPLYLLSFILFLLMVGTGMAAYAQQEQKQPEQTIQQDTLRRTNKQQIPASDVPSQYEQHIRSSADLEIDGLIIDKTITKAGRDFYEVFMRLWEAPPKAKNFTILVEELPGRANISIVSLSVNEEKLFEQPLQPRYDVVEELATYMVGVVYEYLLSDQLNKQLEAEGKKAREVY